MELGAFPNCHEHGVESRGCNKEQQCPDTVCPVENRKDVSESTTTNIVG